MRKFLKTITCLYASIVVASAMAETITFDGHDTIPGYEYIGFEVEDHGNLILIKKVNISELLLEERLRNQQAENIKNITLVIPGRVGNKNIHIRRGAFAGLYSNLLQLKLRFKPENEIRDDRVIKKYVAFPAYCNEMFAGSWSLTEVDLSGLNSAQEIERAEGMFEGCFNLENVKLGNLNLSKAKDMSRMFYGCKNLANLEIGTRININNVGNAKGMFDGCKNLKHLKIKFSKHISTDLDYNHITHKFKVSSKVN